MTTEEFEAKLNRDSKKFEEQMAAHEVATRLLQENHTIGEDGNPRVPPDIFADVNRLMAIWNPDAKDGVVTYKRKRVMEA
jgi:hypothetical protein